jgi:glycosyltransferase involved in cell wall biosynthesis
MKLRTSILYINFAPYDNAGKILDFLTSQYIFVYHFSFNFHYLQNSTNHSCLTVYKKGKVIYKSLIFQLSSHPGLTFLTLPIRSLIFLIQIIYYGVTLRNRYGSIEDYFTVNAYIAWCGIILRRLHLVQRTIFWVWDYYPPNHTNRIVRMMRRIYWQFDKTAGLMADKTVFLNDRLMALRKDIFILPQNKSYPVVPIGTDPVKTIASKYHRPLKLAFFGVVKKCQGLDLVFDNDKELCQLFDDAELHVIGGGPDLMHYKKRAEHSSLKTHFYGYVKNENRIRNIISKCHIGLAPYVPEESNVSHYSDPSKIKAYLSLGTPVITTYVFTFSKKISKSKSGVVIDFYHPIEYIRAVQTIMSNFSRYQKNAFTLSKKYIYTRIYPELLSDV